MKVLIYSKQRKLRNVGGPSGYLYNISEFLTRNPNPSIVFLQEDKLKRTVFGNISFYLYAVVRKVFGFSIKLVALIDLLNVLYRHEHFSKETICYFNSFDFIHLHSAALCLNIFKYNKTTAKIIVTSHSPEPFCDEYIDKMGIGRIVRIFPCLRTFLLRKELLTYDFCDKIMFPVPQAREPYESASLLYKKVFERNEKKFFYVPTSLFSVDMIMGTGKYIGNTELNSGALKLCYIGRHNKTKGYDTLPVLAKKVWEVDDNIYFYIAGKEDPLKGINDYRWKELGWVNTPLLLNEVDAFILPNKQTYFDLILLEVLRQGTPVLLTRTGGNKWFEQFHLSGLFFYDYGDYKTIIDHIKKIRILKEKGCLNNIKKENRLFFQREFNMPMYISRYLEQLNKFKDM